MTSNADPKTPSLLTKTIKGQVVPTIGFGTFELKGGECQKAVETALEVGYRHVDTARMYGNETEVGKGIANTCVSRGKIFLTSKIWWEHLEPDAIRREIEASLKSLKTDYLDLMLIHWPNPDSSLRKSIETLHELRDSGILRNYGVSNFTPTLFQEAVGYGDIFCNQVEYHPLLCQEELLEVVCRNNCALTAYSPLGQGKAIGYSELEKIAQQYGKSSGQIALRWLIEQENVLAIPRSSNPEHIQSNFDIFDFELKAEDHKIIEGLPKNRRFIDPDFAPKWENEHSRE